MQAKPDTAHAQVSLFRAYKAITAEKMQEQQNFQGEISRKRTRLLQHFRISEELKKLKEPQRNLI